MTTMKPEEASVARVKELLSNKALWKGCGGWEALPFYREIHDILFKKQIIADIIANWYLGPLLDEGIVCVEDIKLVAEKTEGFSNIVNNVPAVVAFFEQHFDIPDSTPLKMVSLEIHYGKTEKKEKMYREKLTIKNLEALVRTAFKIPLAALKLYIDRATNLLENDSDLKTQQSGPIVIYVENLQIEFSKVKSMQDALNLCGKYTKIEYNVRDLLKKRSIENIEDKEELDQALTTIKKLRDVLPIENGCETTRRVYIDSVLVAAARISKDIKMEVERTVVAPQARGALDYLF